MSDAELTPEQEDAIEESLAQIERGDCISGEEMLAQLRRMREQSASGVE